MKNSLLIFGTKNFNNSLYEIKEYFNFSLSFYDKNTFSKTILNTLDSVLVDSESCKNVDVLNLVNQIKNKPILFLKNQTSSNFNKPVYDDILHLPSSLTEISDKIINGITVKKFNLNSFIKIKDYIIDKNEKKLKKQDLSITVTEREIQLIELLFNEKKPISKNIILKKVWKYADDTDTHTIETHIYRLRKKILDKFKDESFIINSTKGYSI